MRAMTRDVLLAVVDGVATLTLNRPQRLNALSADMIEYLLAELPRLGQDRTVGAIVITGAGRGFCSGGDVARMAGAHAEPADDAVAVAALRRKMEVARLLHELPVPTIAMVNGAAAGAGLALALACDLRFAGMSAKFTTAFAKVGLPGDFGGSYFLSRLVGAAKARELYFTSDILTADDALQSGLVTRVVADAQLAEVTAAFARGLAQGPRIALGMMKRNLNAAGEGMLADLLDLEAAQQIAAGRTRDHREAAQAFVEKRKPRFVGE